MIKIYFYHETYTPLNVRETWEHALYIPPIGSEVTLQHGIQHGVPSQYTVKRIDCLNESAVAITVGD